MFGLSGEHLLILAGVLLIFGPRKLPELGASVGRALRNFKEGLSGSAQQANQARLQPPSAETPTIAREASPRPEDPAEKSPTA